MSTTSADAGPGVAAGPAGPGPGAAAQAAPSDLVDASALVVAEPPPPTPAPEPRTVAKTSVPATRGETTIGVTPSPTTSTADQGTVKPAETGAVKPTTPTLPKKPVKQAPTRKILPGDLICGACGEGNPPARNFCSRCGTTLREAVVAKRKWWQRFVPHRKQKSMEAGARPWKAGDGSTKRRQRGGTLAKIYVKLRPLGAAVLLLAGLLVGFQPDLRSEATGWVGDQKDSLLRRVQPRYTPLQPIEISSPTGNPEAPVENLIDGNTLTSWIAPAGPPDPAFVVRFDEPFDLARISLWNGAVDGFKEHARPANLHLVFDTGQTFDIAVRDLPDKQEYEVGNGNDIREVEIHIDDTYQSLASPDVGLTEIEFLFKR